MPASSPLPSPIGQAALQYARRGWPVFPCREVSETITVRTKDGPRERVLGAKQPYIATGLKAATTDERTIEGWWRRWPNAMIGLPMGGVTGLFALDFDPRADAATGEVWTLDQLKAALEAQMGCALPVSLSARTQSGGVHVFLRQPTDGGAEIRNRGNLPLHVDVRGRGGYVIAAPSVLAESEGGGRYRWLHGRWDAEAVDAPPALIEILRAPKARASKDVAGDQPAASSSPPARPIAGDDPAAERVRRYALSALDGECRALSAAPLGKRNDQCNASGFALGQLVGAGAIGESVARAALHGAVAGYQDVEKACRSIDNGLAAGAATPRDLSEIVERARSRGSRSPPSGSRPRAPDRDEGSQSSRAGGDGRDHREGGAGGADRRRQAHLDCARHPMTDLGNKDRFLGYFGRNFRWVEQWGWVAWDRRRWSRDMAEALLGQAVHSTIRFIQDESRLIAASGLIPDHPATPMLMQEKEREGGLDYVAKVGRNGEITLFSDQLRGWGRTSEGAGHVACVASMAKANLAAHPDQFDADPLRINLANGTLIFTPPADGKPATGRLGRFDRADMITKIANAGYRLGATCPRFDAYLARVQPAAEMRAFLEEWAGYNMLGDVNAQKMALFYGQGANGKSVWVDQHAYILGDYGWVCGIETFIDQGRYRKGSDATPDLAALAGRRMVRSSEPEEGAKFSDGLIKAMTGSEPLPVRELNKSPFNMRVTFKVTVSANLKPRIGTDHGIQRRVQLVPWDVIIPAAEQDTGLLAKLKDEADGVLLRMVAGALRYLDHGLSQPEAIKDATREYQEENDLLGQFLRLCVTPQPGESIGATPLHELFRAWQTWAGELDKTGKSWSPKYFGQQMKRKGYHQVKASVMLWKDIATLKDVADFIDSDGRPLTRSEPAAWRSSARNDDPDDDDVPL